MVGIAGERLTAPLCTRSTFGFGTDTATPTTLVRRAAALGYRSLALTDLLDVTGAVELFQAAHDARLRALIGATVPVRLDDRDVAPLVLSAASRAGYATSNALITHAHAADALAVPWAVLLAHTPARIHGIHEMTVRTWLERDTVSGGSQILEMSRLKRENEELLRIIGELKVESDRAKKKKGRGWR